jgi:PAS domain S-box-containing protein
MKINFSIRSFLVFLAISFTVPAVLLFGYFEAVNGLQQARDDASEMNRQAAILIQHDLAGSLKEFKGIAEALAVDIDFKTLRFADPTRVKQVLKAHPGIAFLVLNEKSVSVAAYAADREIQVGVDYSDRDYTKQVMSTRQTVISGAIQSRTANLPAVVFGVPLIDADGVFRGMLGGGVPTEEFRTSYQLAPEQFAIITDTFGRTVSTINSQNTPQLANDELFEAEVKPIGWKVVVGLPHRYVLARARNAIYSAVMVALICTLIGGGVASLVAFSTVRGLDKIGRQVERMSAVDLRPIELSETAPYPREVRSLIGNFNNLLSRTARMRLAEFDAISHLADTVFIVRQDGTIAYVNGAGIKSFGDVIGRPLQDVIGEETVRRILSLENPREWKGDATLKRSDGEQFDGFVSSTPVLENGKLTSAVIIVQDITSEKAAREAMVQSEKMITLGELVAGTSHELNNPLAIVSGYADLLLQDQLDPEQRTKIESIRKNAHRAANVVHSLLAFARKRRAERVYTEANSVVEAALQLKEYDLRTSGIRLEKELGRHLPPVFADPNQLQQVLLNVINNAQDAVMASPNARKIRIKTETSDGRVWIRIEDTGSGISKEDLKKIFDPFFTTKPLGKGTGLGLSISYGIVREHGGEIEVSSQAGRGTEVSIMLPAYSPLAAEPVRHPTVDAALPSRRFLVVDDEAEIGSIVQKILLRSGSTADTATSLAEALRLASAKDYDIIISDIKMPGGSGIDLYGKLCSLMPTYRRRFVFLTGDTSNPATIQFLEREGLLYFPKPFDFQVLETLIREAENQATRG